MSIIYECNKKLGLTFVVWDGKVTFAEWQRNVVEMTADPDFRFTPVQINDLRFASIDASVSEKEFQQIIDYVSLHKHLYSGRRLAVLANEEFGKATVFKHMAESLGVSFIVFNDLLIACHWLGVDAGLAEQEIERLRTRLRQDGKVN